LASAPRRRTLALVVRMLGLAETLINVDIAPVIGAFTALIVVLGVPTWVGSRRHSAKLEQIEKATDTGNERNLGETVHDIAARQETQEALLLSHIKESAKGRELLLGHIRESDEIRATVDKLVRESGKG
jgi:hypothetical protein